jgi:hypothetical protein
MQEYVDVEPAEPGLSNILIGFQKTSLTSTASEYLFRVVFTEITEIAEMKGLERCG